MRNGYSDIRENSIEHTARWVTALILLTILLPLRGACSPIPGEDGTAAPPNIHAAAAIVINRDTGATLWAKNPDKRLPPASTTKIATGFLLARDVPPETIIPASPNAAQTPGHALGMKSGETFRARDLLAAILLASANDASVAAAEQMAGREEAFATRMNEWAQASGATNTRFANASGLPASNHFSTAHDLALLARVALQNPVFADVARTRAYSLPRSGNRPPTLLTNENALLWTVPGMEGVKAGWTREAGFCFVGAASRNGLRLITVVLNSPDWQRDTVSLLKYGFAASGKPVGTQFIAPSSNLALSPNVVSRSNVAPAANTAPSNVAPSVKLTPAAKSGSFIGRPVTPSPAAPSEPINEASVPQNGVAAVSPVTGSASDATRADTPVLPALPAIFNGKRFNGERACNSRAISNDTAIDNPVAVAGTKQPKMLPNGQSTIGNRQSAIEPTATNHQPPTTLICFFIALLVAGALAGRKGNIAMPDFLFGLFGKRRKSQPSSGLEAGGINPSPHHGKTMVSAAPEFHFMAPLLERRGAEVWLESVLDTPTRLLEPATRRQARAILNANPDACESKTLALLHAPNMRLRLVGAELISGHAPRPAEDTLLALLKEESVNAEVRADAIQLLAGMGSDRHERLWLQMLLRDGSAPAAAMLARLPRWEEATTQALKHVLTETAEGRAPDSDMKRSLRNAHIACALLAQGHFTRVEAAPFLNAVPANHGEPILVSTLRGTSQPEAIEALIEIVLNGHAYPALQALMEADPRRIRPVLAAQEQNLDGAKQARVAVAKWLLWGEGSEKQIQGMATAGNDLARGALQLARMNRRDPGMAPPDAILAAVQIYSLRLGFSSHAAGDIALAFRKAATDGETQSLAMLPPELQPLAQAYAHPDVYDSVQFAMHGEDGLGALLATLARHPENPQYRRELAFWCDKVEAEHRLMLTNSLCGAMTTVEEETTRTAIEARADDPAPLVRNLALRWLHAHPNFAPVAEAEADCLEA